jgi:hypothetical protein
MQSQDLKRSIDTPGAYSDSVLPMNSIGVLAPALPDSQFELIGGYMSLPFCSAPLVIEPTLHTFQIELDQSTLVGYSYGEDEAKSGHYIHMTASLDPDLLRARMLKLACHFMVDFTPASGLEEMLEKSIEVRDYYTSLQNWVPTPLPNPEPVMFSPVSAVYEREGFSFSEE